jgi:hypothetical protein
MVRHLRQVNPLQITAWIVPGEGGGEEIFENDEAQATCLLGNEIQANEYCMGGKYRASSAFVRHFVCYERFRKAVRYKESMDK